MSINYTQEQLVTLKAAYAAGILEFQDGDERVKYQSMHQMKMAIQDIEDELQINNRPKGARKLKFSNGR
jgi:hypothetical protein